MSIVNMMNCTWKEFDVLPREKSIVFLCISPIEEHGPHLPLGTDYISANDILNSCITHLSEKELGYNYIKYPSIAAGYNYNISDFPGTVYFKIDTIKNILIDLVESFYRHGFNKVILINHHLDLGHIKAIYTANEYLKQKYNHEFLDISSSLIYSEETLIDEDDNFKDEIHADMRETAFMLYKHNELVKEIYKSLEAKQIDIIKFYRQGGGYFSKYGIFEGYIGNPSKASANLGKQLFDNMIESSIELILRYLENGYIPRISSNIIEAMKYIF